MIVGDSRVSVLGPGFAAAKGRAGAMMPARTPAAESARQKCAPTAFEPE